MSEKRTDPATNQNIMRNRIKKAARLAGMLDAIKIRPSVVEGFDDDQWLKAEQSIKSPCSQETRMLIIAFLKFRHKEPIG